MTDKDTGAGRPSFLQYDRPVNRRKWLWLGGGAIVLGAVLWGGFAWFGQDNSAPRYVTEAIKHGDLAIKVSATGTLNPTNQVSLGSELSGTVAQVLVDYNDKVKKGQVLAILDTTKLRQQIAKSQAALQGAQATAEQMRATLNESKTKLTRYEEVSRLSGGKVPATTEMDAARADYARAQANLASAEAAIAEARATLESNQTDLTKSQIRSPVNGVVLSRAVDPGQTVAASLQAVTLFTIAEDLTKMELIVSAAESDVGQIKAGQRATFNVDAYPDKQYPASIKLVRVGSKTVSNVVSYETVLEVGNSDLSLLPGMTATADILVAERKNVLLLPNAALRFKPTTKNEKSSSSGSILSALLPRPPGRQRPAAASSPAHADGSKAPVTVWANTPEGPVAHKVQPGLSDGKYTEILASDLKDGDEIITNAVTVKK
ncbi:MAG: efflux RND transporter periplasmic adaptor subunit [Formivibrio sp.]|nr:efflux RND transporter periplasmic adaptor subunit [Formivibrio sp.]